jgi:uncharacterized protein with NAD-binding domain and iron-sulfur cluster
VTDDDRPLRVAVVGGGCAALSAAFELTQPEQQGRYEVTVYQVGWRLGGKGASGRGPAGRIEEHGLHVWMGFYENAFRLMRACYGALGRDRARVPLADWRDAFVPAPLIAVTERGPGDGWLPWMAALPPAEGLPGDPLPPGARPWSMLGYVRRMAGLLQAVFASLDSGREPAAASAPAPDAMLAQLTRWLRFGELATLAGLSQAAGVLDGMLGASPRLTDGLVSSFVDALAANARAQLEARAGDDPELRRLWTVVDLTLATMRGIVAFGLLTDARGLDAIDQYDCREWLLLNGASRTAVDSAYMRGLYDLGFSYEDGDPARPRIAAGQALRGLLRMMFTYRGAFFWKMQAGMGDVVFSPLYEVLRARGVRFRFFHRLEQVRLAERLLPGDTPHVAALEFDLQAQVARDRYEPLVDVRGLPCWPAGPDWAQLVDGELLRSEGRCFESHWDRRRVATTTLRVGHDFDFVVLGTGIGEIPRVAHELVARDARWRAMVDHVRTVATQAFQVWLAPDMAALGWPHPNVTLSGFVEPFDTWADMTHLVPLEAWPAPPGSIGYFCSVLPELAGVASTDPAYPLRQRERVHENALAFLRRDVRHLWPAAIGSDGEFRWDLLVVPPGTSVPPTAERFASQFWTANVNPSDRYTLTLPGSSAYRISPLDTTWDNFTVCGDWTDCGFNAGCVEAAVMSGRLAAHAISRLPALEDIVGFDHP